MSDNGLGGEETAEGKTRGAIIREEITMGFSWDRYVEESKKTYLEWVRKVEEADKRSVRKLKTNDIFTEFAYCGC